MNENKYPVLVAEDNPENLNNAKNALKDQFDLTLCKNTQEALIELSKRKFFLVLTDKKMPTGKGLEPSENAHIEIMKACFEKIIPAVTVSGGFHGSPQIEIFAPNLLDRKDFINGSGYVKSFCFRNLELKTEEVWKKAIEVAKEMHPAIEMYFDKEYDITKSEVFRIARG